MNHCKGVDMFGRKCQVVGSRVDETGWCSNSCERDSYNARADKRLCYMNKAEMECHVIDEAQMIVRRVARDWHEYCEKLSSNIEVQLDNWHWAGKWKRDSH